MTQTHALTRADVDALTLHLCSRYGVAVHRRNGALGSIILGAAGVALQAAGAITAAARVFGFAGAFVDTLAGLPSSKAFERYGTTIGPLVFLPSWTDEPEAQPVDVAVLTVHEVTHWLEQQASGIVRYAVLYVSEREFRATQETGAALAEAELRHALTGVVPPIADVVRIDHGYALRPGDVEFGRLLGEQEMTAVAAGAYGQPVAVEAIAFLRARGVTLYGASL
jgi:hypothetical protein